MNNMNIYQKSLKMIYLNNHYTDFIFLVIIVCVTYSSTILCLIIFNFPFPKLKIMRDDIVDYNIMHTMTSRFMHSMQ